MSFTTSINKLLRRNGTTSYSLKKITTTVFDLNNPTKAPTTSSTSHSLLSYPGQYKRNQVDGELVRIGDVKLYVDPTGMTVIPTTSDKITYGSDEWDIIDVKTYTQGNTAILYILQIRN